MREPGSYGAVISAEMIGSHHRPTSFASGRVCAAGGCATRLSIYNSDPFCSIHGQVPGTAAPASRRRPGAGVRRKAAGARRKAAGRAREVATAPGGARGGAAAPDTRCA